MAFSLGGIIRGIGGTVVGSVLGGPIGTAIGAIQGLGALVKGGGTVGAASVVPYTPYKTDVRGATPATYSTTAHAGQVGHYTRTGRFVKTNARGKAIRRMNPMNVHAARRAIRRIHSGEKLLRKIFSV